MSLSAPTRSGNQGPTRDRYATSQRTISSSLLSWTSWAEGQGDDQGPTVLRSERSEGLGSLLVVRDPLLVLEAVRIYPTLGFVVTGRHPSAGVGLNLS